MESINQQPAVLEKLENKSVMFNEVTGSVLSRMKWTLEEGVNTYFSNGREYSIAGNGGNELAGAVKAFGQIPKSIIEDIHSKIIH